MPRAVSRPLPANKLGPKHHVEYEEPANCFEVSRGYRRQPDPTISIESEAPERAQTPQFGALCVGHQTVARLASAVMSLSGGKGVQGRGEKSQESPGGRKLDPGGVGDRDGDWNWGQGKRGKEDAPPNQPTFDDAGLGWGCVLCPSRCTPPSNRPTTSRPSRP